MVVAIEILGVTAGAGRAAEDGGDVRPVCHTLKDWWGGMAIRATTLVDSHRAIGGMTDSHAGWGVFDDAESGNRMVYSAMGYASALILMAVETVDSARNVA